jgi:membrane protease YdiL (CAAX protease family)
VIAGLGLIVVVAGAAWLVYETALAGSTGGLLLPAGLTAAGAAGLLGGLGWLGWRGVKARRHLPPHRYRGPSVILLFFGAIALSNLLSLIPLLAAVASGQDVAEPGPTATTVLLLISPVAFLVVVAVFVLWPRALAGARLGDGPMTVRNVARGLALGAGAWVLAALVTAALSWLWTQATGEEPVDNQLVATLAASLPPLVAIGLIGVLTPVAEELFFRWVAVNAWEREHGTRAAILGSAIMFGVAHIAGGTLLVLPPIFMLGLVLAIAYVTTRSLPLVVATHVMFNCLSVAVLFVAGV